MDTNNRGLLATIIISLIVITAISVYFSKYSNLQSPSTEGGAVGASTPIDPKKIPSAATTGGKKPVTLPAVNTAGYNSYNNSQYNFIVKYPASVQAKNTFSTFHELGTNWRVYAGLANQGKNLIELSIFNVDQGSLSTGRQTYPLYFSALVRIGVSPNVKECYAKDAGYTDEKITDVNINGTTWKRFSTSDGAMMKYMQVESYRTIHNNMCFAIEQIKNGSNYRDEKMSVKTTDAELASYYALGATIVRTFAFIK